MDTFDIIPVFSMSCQPYLTVKLQPAPKTQEQPPMATHTPTPAPAKVLIACYSRNGATEALAKALAEGAQAAGAEVRLRRAREIVGPEIMAYVPGWADSAKRMNDAYPAPTPDDATWADAIVFGTPTRF